MTLKHPSTFTVRGLPRPLFGETYAIISVWKADDTTWKAEYDILTKVPHEHLIRDVIQFDATDYPDDLPPFDEAAMETEAIQQAETALPHWNWNAARLTLNARIWPMNRSTWSAPTSAYSCSGSETPFRPNSATWRGIQNQNA